MVTSTQISITYVPSDCGSIIPGKSKAPGAFQHVGLGGKIHATCQHKPRERYALESPARFSAATFSPGGVRNEDINVSVCEAVKDALTESLVPDSFQLIIGGECCMLPGILSTFWDHADSQVPQQRVGLIYIDADTDLNSPTDPSSIGTFAGMTMAHLVGLPGALPSLERFSCSSGGPVCNASNTVFFGTDMSLPGNKREHFEYLLNNNYHVVSSASVAKEPELRARETLAYLDEMVDVIMVHLDVDSIDAGTFPLANVPNFTGVEFEVMMRALKVFLGSPKVAGLTIAEVNPDHDPDFLMIEKLASCVADMLGAEST
ncbi:hypothetical protein NW752_007271 [Fusarium irregulare]|uniref:Arginase n=1 Tax=Fusarium irregulare TaxID=2494466 RepID=A0A9W8PM76_9HYPO|nr:hypothetical protein NW766_007832 [Fusarium irregulare]KAJ4014506.1 hypothetical protein NW752_007271 [Fusarium irregulare]